MTRRRTSVSDRMAEAPPALSPDDPVDRAEALLTLSELRHWPVTTGRRLDGIIGLSDVLAHRRRRWFDDWEPATPPALTASVMGLPPLYVHLDDDLGRAAELVGLHRLSCLPVVADRALVGLLRLPDLLSEAISRILRRTSGPAARPTSRLMTPAPLVTIQVHARLSSAELMMRHGLIRHLPVLDGDRLVGILSDRDILAVVRTSLEPPADILAGEVMTPRPATVEPDLDSARAGMILLERRIGALPVVADGGRLAGILTRSDFLGELAIDRTTHAETRHEPPAQ